ncbi:G-rich sequence factor 1 isoform X2 [Echeneis naucrates]|uniref:G-rich sequence factor 1 isoform X2 n=1 Tax=Echeneis naucrates TaxID=173247 RepID=UPI00111441B1|nr:G-rich sequence factor 1-like isoform X2 [Echeneis naucrates]
MSASGRSLLVLLQRCVPVRLTVPAAAPVRLSTRCGFLHRPTRTGCERRLCQPPSALVSSRLGFCTEAKDRQTGAPAEEEYPPLPEYKTYEEPEKEFYIVQVKGLPWSCSAQDLLQFFSECRIRDGEKGIHLTVDAQGRPSGRAFIEMEHEADVGKALEKHRQYLGPRFVEVYEVTNRVAEAILKKTHQDTADNWVVRLRGLPFSCTEADVTQFFSGLDIRENGITFVTDYRGRKSGEAFVQFSSQESAAGALQRDREVIGSRYIEVFPSRTDQIYSSRRRKTTTSAFPQTGPRPGTKHDHQLISLLHHNPPRAQSSITST